MCVLIARFPTANSWPFDHRFRRIDSLAIRQHSDQRGGFSTRPPGSSVDVTAQCTREMAIGMDREQDAGLGEIRIVEGHHRATELDRWCDGQGVETVAGHPFTG